MQSSFALRLGTTFFFAVIAFAFLIAGENPSNISLTFFSLTLSASLLVSLLPQFANGLDYAALELSRAKAALSYRLDVPRKEWIKRHDPYLI
jgi:uncharacterized membrane protein